MLFSSYCILYLANQSSISTFKEFDMGGGEGLSSCVMIRLEMFVQGMQTQVKHDTYLA